MTDAVLVLRQWITANPGTQWDFKRDPEMRLGQPGQQQSQGVDTRVDYELYSRASGAVIDTFPARNDDEAQIRLNDYREHGAGQSNPDNFDVRRAGRAPIAGSTLDLQRQRAAASADAAQGGIIDVDIDLEPAPAPQPAGGEFTGNWLIRAEDGTVLHRFGGIGNSQADANRTAQTWAQRNPDVMRQHPNGVDVVPEMNESLREYRMPQPSQGPGRYKDLNEPLGPETPPKMPAGTVKVDVSDTQDWYQLGQDISNLELANKSHYNQGPPHTVLAFGSEDLEHMYIQQLKRLGLNTHDLDESDEDDLDEGQLVEDIENFPIANVRRANGAIGNQGVNIEQAADVLTHAAGMQVSPDMSMRQLVDALRADPAAQQRLRQFVQQNPITVYALPDGSYHLQDGHHRTFLLNLLGDETVPAIVKENEDGSATQFKTVEFEGLTLKVIKQGHELIVDALDDWGNKVLGHVKFNIGDGRELDPQDLHVDEKYQGQGIARVMYDYVKSLGYTIVRSWDQTDAGAGFWNKHRGEDVRVWENFADGKNPGRKGLSKRVGVNTKASVSDLRKTAKNSSGEKQRMAHWLANMKAGRAKAKRK